jgi:hypothetical protein
MPNVPVLLLVGTFEPFDEGEFKSSGAHRYLKKPFDSQELLRIVGELESLQPAAPEAPAAPAPPAPPVVEATAAPVPPAAPTEEDPFADFGTPAAPAAAPATEADPFADFGSPAAPASADPDDGGFRLGSLEEEPTSEPTTEAVPAVEEVEGGVQVQQPAFEVEDDLALGLESEPVVEAEPVFEAEPVVETAPPEPAAPEPAPAEVAAVPAGNGAGLSDEDVDRIARRVADLVGERLVKDVAWEVIPDLAEVIIKDRLRQLESQVE